MGILTRQFFAPLDAHYPVLSTSNLTSYLFFESGIYS